MSTPSAFKWRHFLPEIILLNVRGYCHYALSYHNLEEMMRERGVEVDHSTINRWVLQYAPELDKRLRPHLKPTNDLWRQRRVELSVSRSRFTRQYLGLHNSAPSEIAKP
jgi:transposase-like protein